MSPEQLTQAIAAYAADKKAIDIVALDLRGIAGYTDFFLICSGGSDRQTKAIHDGIHLGMKKEHDTLPRRGQGGSEAKGVPMAHPDHLRAVLPPPPRGSI